MKIELHTKLHDGIYKSSGGGQDVVVKTFSATAKGMLAAMFALSRERASNIRSFGNIGCGGSWLALDGVRIDDNDLADIPYADEALHMWSALGRHGRKPANRTETAAELLQRLGVTL